MCSVRDEEALSSVDPSTAKRIELLDQLAGVDDDAIPDDALDVRVEDARWNQVQGIGVLADHDGVTGVRPAVVANHHVVLGGQ